jgi:NADH-quinone oxidoreductase subunit I
MGSTLRAAWRGFMDWVGNIVHAVVTVLDALRVTLRTWIATYSPSRKTFTEHYEYPELPLVVSPRYRGFHRYDLTTCIACDRCARDCPVDCIYIGKERSAGKKGFRVTSFVIDYTKCMFCAMCTESCPVDCIFMGSTHDLSGYSRDGCLVDFSRLPLEIAWGRATLNPTVVTLSKVVTRAVHDGPNQ